MCRFARRAALACVLACGAATPSAHAGTLRVGLVFDAGGKEDQSFNTGAWLGARRAVDEFDVVLKDVEPGSVANIPPAVRAFAEAGFDLVIGVGFVCAPAIEAAARDFPQVAFCIVDTVVDAPNVASLVFRNEEGAYLVGVIAGASTQTGTVGFVGGMDIPLIHDFEAGFRAGVRRARPGTTVLRNYAGITPAAWTDPATGKELAMAQYAQGADVIFVAAGATNLGVFDAAAETGNFAIGCDLNQNGLKPGVILTSMLKRVDVAVYSLIRDAAQGQPFRAGAQEFGVAEGGLDFALDEHNRPLLSPEVLAAAERARADIASGAVQVPSARAPDAL